MSAARTIDPRPLVAGVDQCPAGWLAAIGDQELERVESVILPDLKELPQFQAKRRIAVVAVDVPIGLVSHGGRPVDAEARAFLDPRRNSVFSPPIRPVLHCSTWEEANQRSKDTHGKGLSQQGFGIAPGIRDVNACIDPANQGRIVEEHPEVCFPTMKGKRKAICGPEDRALLRSLK